MSNDTGLHINEGLERVAKLKERVTDFAKTEAQLVQDIRNRGVAEMRTNRASSEAVDVWQAAETEKVEIGFAAKQARAVAVYQSRRTRIDKFHRAGVTDLKEQARRARERWLGELQMRHFSATRNLPVNLKAISTKLAEVSAVLAERRTVLLSLERSIRRAMGGYGAFIKLLRQRRDPVEGITQDYEMFFERLDEGLLATNTRLAEFRKQFIARLFSIFPPLALVPVVFVGILAAAYFLVEMSPVLAGAIAIVVSGLIIVVHQIGAKQAAAAAHALAQALHAARDDYTRCAASTQLKFDNDRNRVQAEYDKVLDDINQKWDRADEVERNFAANLREKIEKQAPRATAKNEHIFHPKMERTEAGRAASLAAINQEAEARRNRIAADYERACAILNAEEAARWKELETAWRREVLPLCEAITELNASLAQNSPPWNAEFVDNWQPPRAIPSAIRFGAIEMDLHKLGGMIPKDPRLALPCAPEIATPLALSFPDQGSILFETPDSGGDAVIGALNNIILRLFTTTTPGKLSFTIIDPVGLGQNFAGLMHLSDFEDSLINRRIWTQREQIEERLAELNEHIEKVIQMYLRNEYATITEYNEQAGSVAEKYHFLVVAGFPANFSETAAKRLQSIAASGPRCGVFTLIHWDRRQPLPDGFVPDDLRKNGVWLRRDGLRWLLGRRQLQGDATIVFDLPPVPALAVNIVHKIGESSIDANRVQVPFEQVAPKNGEVWTGDSTTELKIAIGRTGATKLQYLSIGKGTRQHALFAGKTGSGKSTLFHVIITNIALTYSPDQVEFYLIDFKKGVEFKCYARHHLPHARVVAIESDREFGVSVLQRVDDELRRRGDMFRKLGAQDIAGYKRAGGTEPMPRALLIIDEFQEFFVQDDDLAQTASLLFDRIVRQGRAFGIHVLLGSQTLGGAYTLARATLGQMVIRVALQCNEADAYLIMDDNNPAPRLLSRPGEGIYNDSAGAIEGNSPFQVVWLSDSERDDRLMDVEAIAAKQDGMTAQPIVFEGNAPADIGENNLLRTALATAPVSEPSVARCWLGAPNSIKGPTEAAFSRQAGSNLLIVGQRDDTVHSMFCISLISLAAQFPAGTARFFLFDAGNRGTDARGLDEVAAGVPGITVVRGGEIPDVMSELSAELKARSAEGALDALPIFVFIHGLQKFKKLQQEDEFDFSGGSDSGPGAAAQMATLLTEGGSLGIHFIVAADTFNNVGRFMSRKALSEFEMRVVFQMSANDSASLIDSPAASGLGLHRALFYNEQEGYTETFRPYAMPDSEWIRKSISDVARQTPRAQDFPGVKLAGLP